MGSERDGETEDRTRGRWAEKETVRQRTEREGDGQRKRGRTMAGVRVSLSSCKITASLVFSVIWWQDHCILSIQCNLVARSLRF